MTLAETLDRVARLVPYLRSSTAVDGDEWCGCDELVGDRTTLAGVIDRTMAGFGTSEPAVAASLFTQAYAFRVGGVALAAHALGLPVPDVAPAVTAVRLDRPRPTEVAHLCPDVGVMKPDELSSRLVSGHLDPFVDEVHAVYRVGERLLRGNVAASCAVAFRAVEGALTGDRVVERAQVRARAEAFVAATPSFVGLGAFSVARAGEREGWYWDRTNCCLWFRTGAEEYCDNCSLLDPATRSAQRMRELAEAAS